MGRSGGSGGRSSGGSSSRSRSSGGRSGGSFGRSRSSSSFSTRSNKTGSSSSHSRSNSSFGTRSNKTSGPGGFFSRTSKTGSNLNNKNSGNSNYGRPYPMQPRSGSSYGNNTPRGCGCSNTAIVIIIIAILIIFISAFALNSIFDNSSPSNTDITQSSIEREALPKGSVNETGYYTDELDWIGNQTELEKGLKSFYQQTGVQPYLFITDEINGSHSPSSSELDEFANTLYDELFTDEAHLLFVFFEYNDSYMDRYVCGTQAKTVIDTEAADILLDYIDRYYYDSDLTDEEFFSKSFSEAADRIMTVTKSPWITVLIIIFIAVILIVLFLWWKNIKKQKNKEAKQTEEMLKTPLEKFSDSEASELAKKYSDQSNDQK